MLHVHPPHLASVVEAEEQGKREHGRQWNLYFLAGLRLM